MEDGTDEVDESRRRWRRRCLVVVEELVLPRAATTGGIDIEVHIIASRISRR